MTFTLVPKKTLTVVTSTNDVLTIQSSHINWDKIVAALKRNDEKEIVALIDMKQTVVKFGNDLSYRGNIEIRNGQVFYRGEQLFGEDVNRILTFITDSIPADGMIQFLERKLGNPSHRSIQSMYSFLENRNMPISPSGCFLGYKGVNADFSSRNTGAEPLIKGRRLDNGSIDNSIGEEILMERRYVCDDFNQTCGAGLHVGSLNYAKGWAGDGGKVVIVEVDPANVVSVPTAEHEKLRCCGYRVVGEFTMPLNDVFTSEFEQAVKDNNGDLDADGPNYNDDVCSDCGEDIDFCLCYDDCSDCNGQRPAATDTPPEVVEVTIQCSDYDSGRELGIQHGKSHAKRLYRDEDETDARRKNLDYIVGYNQGYREARKGE